MIFYTFPTGLAGLARNEPARGDRVEIPSLPEFKEHLLRHITPKRKPSQVAEKKHRIPGFVLANLHEGTKASEHVLSFPDVIGLDYDNISEDAALTLLEALDPYEYVLYTTASHLTLKRVCLRIVLKLDRAPTEAKSYLDAWVSCALEFKGLDAQCKDPARGYTYPVRYSDPPIEPDIEYHPGLPFVWESGLSVYESEASHKELPLDLTCEPSTLWEFVRTLQPLFDQAEGKRNALRMGLCGILQSCGVQRGLGQQLFNEAFQQQDSRAKFAALWLGTEKKLEQGNPALCWGPPAFCLDVQPPDQAESIRQLFSETEYVEWRLRLQPPRAGSSDREDPLTNPPAEIFAELDQTKDGDPKSTIRNAQLILAPLVRYDSFKDRLIWIVDVPSIKAKAQSVLSDQDIRAVGNLWMACEWRWSLRKSDIFEAFEFACGAGSYDALTDYVNSLPAHDGVPRLETIFEGVGVAPGEYPKEVTRVFLCGLIHRALSPGSDFDHVLVLKGGEGWGKTKLLRALMPRDDWATSLKGKLDSADAMSKWSTHWIAEWAETKSQSMDALKELFTESADSYRKAYGHFSNHRARRVCFYATTNRDQWHDDSHGGRRFLVLDFPARKADLQDQQQVWAQLDLIKAQRDQIWAEALKLYRENPHWSRLSELAYQTATKQIQRDSVKGFWEEYLIDLIPTLSEPLSTVELAQMIDPHTKLDPYRMRKFVQTLKTLGFEKSGDNPKHLKWIAPLPDVVNLQQARERKAS